MQINLNFIKNVKLLCKERGITINKLIEDCEFNKSFVYNIEKRDKTPSIEVLYLVANYFGVTTDYLLKGEEEQIWHTDNKVLDSNVAKEERFSGQPVKLQLKALRREQGLSIAELAAQIGESIETYTYYETEALPDEYTHSRFARIMGYFPDERLK